MPAVANGTADTETDASAGAHDPPNADPDAGCHLNARANVDAVLRTLTFTYECAAVAFGFTHTIANSRTLQHCFAGQRRVRRKTQHRCELRIDAYRARSIH